MTCVLWIAPNLNHYKTRFLNYLATNEFKLTVFSGSEISGQGHRKDKGKYKFNNISVDISKQRFQYAVVAYKKLFSCLKTENFDVVLMPAELKHLFVILFLCLCRHKYKYSLVSYNHAALGSKTKFGIGVKKLQTQLVFTLYDKIIFYTEHSRNWAVKNKIIHPSKAYFANNTLDTGEIWRNYSFDLNRNEIKTILFIGRLVKIKRVDLLLCYFSAIQKIIPSARLKIIGDGTENDLVKSYVKSNSQVEWCGAIVDESLIATHMKNSHLVFIPGASGLSIVHAFCYGKPYVTLKHGNVHGPELTYLKDGINGMLLDQGESENVLKIIDLLGDQKRYSDMCLSAHNTSKKLSIENWCKQIRIALQ